MTHHTAPIAILAAILAAGILGSAAAQEPAERIDERALGLILGTSVFDVEAQDAPQTVYPSTAPGIGVLLPKTYADAPPMIPHVVAGFPPIVPEANICLACHLQSPASEANTAKRPPLSHFKDREGVVVATLKKDAKDIPTADSMIYLGRYNCVQCHAPQANARQLVPNVLEASFRPAPAAR